MPTKLKANLLAAIERRKNVVATERVYRVFDGVADGDESLFIDFYDGVLLCHYLPKDNASRMKALSAELCSLKEWFEENLGVTCLYLQYHGKDPREAASRMSRILWGKHEDEVVVKDRSLSFILKPGQSVHGGLFVDTRELRRRFLAKSYPRVINLFSFTGSLGVAAAVGGASEVIQVDSSPVVHEWAKRNWVLNSTAGTLSCQMKFVCDDVRNFLKHEKQRVLDGQAKADLVILDPPSFGRGRKRVFSFKNEASELLKCCLEVLSASGSLVFITNSRSETPESMEAILRAANEGVSWSCGSVEALLSPKEDFISMGKSSIAMRGVMAIG